MSTVAQLTVTSGPDRGRVYDLAEDLVHIGRAAENQVVLADPTVAEHQASIVCRAGRYAIYTPLAETVDVDGDLIPPDQWVWLPMEARIKFGDRTSVRFTSPNGEAATPDQPAPPAPAAPATPPPTPRPAGQPAGAGSVDPFADDDEEEPVESPTDAPAEPTSKGKGKKKGKRKRRRKKGEPEGKAAEGRQVARFVTDQSGDTVVTLGEDGQLPDLKLREGATARERRREPDQPQGTSPLLYVGLGVSVLCTVALLLLDFTPGQSSAYQRSLARQELRDYIGGEGEAPRPYQEAIRDAMIARQRGDFTAERRAYRRVLDMLNSIDENDVLGLTGNPDRDARMRELIGTLLSR